MSRLLQDLVRMQADRRPEAVALVFQGERVTYGDLETTSNRLARLLRAAGCRRGDRVGLLVPKSMAAVVGILGVLKADCAYVPIDTTNPPSRVARILEICESPCVLATRASGRLVREALARVIPARPRVGWLDARAELPEGLAAVFTREDLAAEPGDPPTALASPRDMAHILFTSGSTGVPKGVVITHANVMSFVDWARRYFGIVASDRMSGHPPLHFDLSTFDLYGTFSAGAELHLVPPELNLLPHQLAAFIRESRLTQWFSVPSILTHLAKLDAVRHGDFPELKRVLWCGETFPTPALIHWMTRVPHAAFVNLYGPTEATIASSYYRVLRCPDDEQAAIPIGQACDGEELLVLDEALRPVPSGAIGDLYIRGVGLSPGYWNDSERTRAVFLDDPFGTDPSDRLYKTGDLARIGEDGLVYLVGRADTQVKSRGYRIELGEIEAALNRIEDLRESAVVAVRTDGFEGTLICCAYVQRPGVEVSPRSLRARLGEMLPPYMLPARWLALDRMPRNASDKVDRARLRIEFEEAEMKRRPEGLA